MRYLSEWVEEVRKEVSKQGRTKVCVRLTEYDEKIEMYTDYLFPLLPLKRKAGPKAKASPPKAKAATKIQAGLTSTSAAISTSTSVDTKGKGKAQKKVQV